MRPVGEMILQALGQNPLFISAAVPMKVLPPLLTTAGAVLLALSGLLLSLNRLQRQRAQP